MNVCHQRRFNNIVTSKFKCEIMWLYIAVIASVAETERADFDSKVSPVEMRSILYVHESITKPTVLH